MQKEDISNNLLQYPQLTSTIVQKAIVNDPTNNIFHSINLLDLDQYRIKSYCHYEPQLVSTTDYSIFQIEILNEELQRYYQGRFILEIWNKNGDRIFQKILKDEITSWKLYNNTFLYKGANESPLIYLIWLADKKMIAIKHPYDDSKEVDLMYFDNHLIVAQQFNFRFIQINSSEVTTTISQFLNPDESHQPLFEREFSGIIQNDKIFQLQPTPYKNELLFICVADNYQIVYYKFNVNRQLERRQVSLIKVEIDPSTLKNKKSKLDKKQMKLLEVLADVQQISLIVKNQIPFLFVLRKNQVLEVIENFQQTVYVEQRLNLTKLLPSFGEKITFQFSDGSITQSPSFDKISEKNFMTESEFYKQQAMPPKTSTLYDIHKMIHFYQDSVIVNQSLFLLRDNVVFVIDTFSKQVVSRFFQKQKVQSLHKLKLQSEDENGYKVTTYKVVAVHKNGTLQVFIPNDNNQMVDWIRTEITQTPMAQQKEVIVNSFQNQNSISNLYFLTQVAQGEQQKVYQMLYNTQIIELNLKLRRGDYIFSVNSVSRQREMLGIVDSKYLIIYRNDKGNLIKVYQLNHTRFDFRDQVSNHSLLYFQKEYVLVLTKSTIFKINLSTSTIEQSQLSDSMRMGGNCFLDATCFYFLTDGEEEGQSKLAIADTSMIESSFKDITKDETKNAIIDKNNQKGTNKLKYPTWSFQNAVKRLDYDEFNSVINLQFSNYEIIQVPLLHRNTFHFIGMGERSYYLAFKRYKDLFFALDKSNYLSCWSMINGQLLSKTYLTSADYKFYSTDKDLYDKDWFNYTLIYRPNEASPNQGSVQYRTYKIIDIDEKGNVFEWLTFIHPVQKQMETHLYFSTDLNLMIEVLVNKNKKGQSTYNLYQMESVLTQKWKFINTLNTPENQYIEWHKKTFYPYTINMKTLEMANQESLKDYDTYKFVDKERIKILNTQDGIEMIYNLTTKQIESFMALQYSFPNTKESFYDKKCGHFYIQEVTSRLQNFYESIRRKIYLQNKTKFNLRSLDVSAKDYKYKYVVEQGYTLLDYQFFIQFIQGKEKFALKTLKQMSNDHVQRIVHNIFPDGNNTLLHYLAQSDMGFECIDLITELAKKEGFVIPFLTNSDELTPLDITVNNKDFKQTNSLVKMLSKTPMDHHSRLISHLTHKLIDMNLPALEKYFDRRRFQTGVCKTIKLGRIDINPDQEFKTVTSTLLNDNADTLNASLMNPKFKEQSINLEIIDVPLHQFKGNDQGQKQQIGQGVNEYEIRVVKSLANTSNQDLFNQKSVRAFIDFMWPQSRSLIIKNLFLPYLAFILYYMVYLMVLKKLNITQDTDPSFFKVTAGMFTIFDVMFKVILFLGCYYFFYQDFHQIKTFTNNPIVLWSYANIFPLILMIFIIAYDLFIDSDNRELEKTFYSASSFFIWIRVVHLMKCFEHTAYLLRMGAEILHRMRYLISFVVISFLAFGFTFYFVSEYKRGVYSETPFQGMEYMFQVLLGQYDADDFNNIYLSILLVLVSFFNIFFIFTLIISLSVTSFSKNNDVDSNEAYQDKASMIALYSYLMNEKVIREPAKKYLLIATVTEGKKGQSNGINGGADMQTMHAKMLKNMDRRLNSLTSKVEKTLKDISDRLDTVSQQRNE